MVSDVWPTMPSATAVSLPAPFCAKTGALAAFMRLGLQHDLKPREPKPFLGGSDPQLPAELRAPCGPCGPRRSTPGDGPRCGEKPVLGKPNLEECSRCSCEVSFHLPDGLPLKRNPAGVAGRATPQCS